MGLGDGSDNSGEDNGLGGGSGNSGEDNGLGDGSGNNPNVDQNDLNYYNDMKNAGYSQDELNQLQGDLQLPNSAVGRKDVPTYEGGTLISDNGNSSSSAGQTSNANSAQQSNNTSSTPPNNADANTPQRSGRSLMNNIRAHSRPGMGKRTALGTYRGIKGAFKFGTKTAFTLAGGTLGAIGGVAAGKGLGGMAAGAISGGIAGSALGGTAGRIFDAPETVVRAGSTLVQGVRREVDIFNGNTNFQDKDTLESFKKDENNQQYLKDKITEESGGRVPSNKEVKERMNSLDPYIKEGLTDIKEALKAQKAENLIKENLIKGNGVGEKEVSQEKAAIMAAKIAAIAKDKGITADVLGDGKKFNAKLKDLTQEFATKQGVSKDEAKIMADRTLNIMKAQNGQAHNLGSNSSGNTGNPNENTRTLGKGNEQRGTGSSSGSTSTGSRGKPRGSNNN